jgi:signal transduction histidine kinase
MSQAACETCEALRQQVEMLKDQLARAQKMAALGELLSTTTHEFNNVLMSVGGYAKMGLRHKDEPTRHKSFTKILAASDRAAKICKNVLGVARNRSGDFEPTDLAQLIDDAMLLLEREMRKYHVSIERQYTDVPEAMVSSSQIQQVLINLLVNARQAMPSGGTVFIKLAHDRENNTVDLTVRDTGEGIAADKLPRIFDSFYSTKQGPDATGKGGTGVGLSACREIIEAHHGRIRVASTVGRGTAFTLKLPAVKSEAEIPAPIAPPVSVPHAGVAPSSTIG